MPYVADIRDPLHVLLIDDDETLCALAERQMQRRGHVVTQAQTGQRAIELLAKGNVDVIALDHSLLAETGLDILGRLPDRGERPPVVYVTGSADARVALEALRAGADEYVIKEIGAEFFELLTAAIEHVYERWRLKQVRDEQALDILKARDRAELLLKEMNHRVANSLGLVAAMVRMQASALTDEAAVKALNETQARITAIAGVHRHIYSSDNVAMLSMHDYLKQLVKDLQTSLHDYHGAHEIVLEAADISMTTDKAIWIGIAVSELVTNAFKYAYAPGKTGSIRVTLRKIGDAVGELAVEDDGIGFDPRAPTIGTGVGAKILEAMRRGLGGEIAHGKEVKGARVSLTFPLEKPAP
ncbi:MAG: response regulator [Hyphomicrobiales bacterium]|nr:response regulator [Hyphomicrobiales bacterium]